MALFMLHSFHTCQVVLGFADRYVTSLYWAVATMTSVGYGDISAVNDVERIVSIVWMVLGAAVFSNLMSGISAILEGLGTSQAQIAAEKENIHEFLKARKVRKSWMASVRYV